MTTGDYLGQLHSKMVVFFPKELWRDFNEVSVWRSFCPADSDDNAVDSGGDVMVQAMFVVPS